LVPEESGVIAIQRTALVVEDDKLLASLVDTIANTPLARAIDDVLVESVFNAIKHQSPDRVDTTVHRDESGQVTLTVTHPGHLPDSVTPGLGTTVYHELTTHHTLENINDQVVFVARFLSPILTRIRDGGV
jgi:hypothetical protein